MSHPSTNINAGATIYSRLPWQAQQSSTLVCWLGLVLVTLISYHPASLADTHLSTKVYDAEMFYQQLIKKSAFDRIGTNNSLLDKIVPHYDAFSLPLSNSKQDDDLAFNYLWMQQYQLGYSHKNGGAAAGKLIRMGLKSLYKSYTNSNSVTNAAAEDDFADKFSNMDYRLRVSGDKLKLGVKYSF